MSMDWVIEANSLSAELLRPDLNIYIDISPEVSMHRIQKGRDSIDLYETLDNLRMVREKYFEAFEKQKFCEQIYITDGNRTTEEIAADVRTEISRLTEN
jgi:dTMP kinase